MRGNIEKHEIVLADIEECVNLLNYKDAKLMNRLAVKRLISEGFNHLKKRSKLHIRNNMFEREFE